MSMPVSNRGGLDRALLYVQVAGFVQYYEGLTYATVIGAGHMVGQAKPEQGLALIDKFLHDLVL